jgi:tetratricopeptide (TPR) repeat protein
MLPIKSSKNQDSKKFPSRGGVRFSVGWFLDRGFCNHPVMLCLPPLHRRGILTLTLSLLVGFCFPPLSHAASSTNNTTYPLSDFEKGVLYFYQSDYVRALAPLRSAIALDEQNVNARYYLAETLRQMGHLNEAQSQYLKIMQIAPTSQSAKLSVKGLASLRSQAKGLEGGQWKLAVTSQGESGLSDRYTGPIGEGGTYIKQSIGVNGVVRWSLLKPVGVWIEKSAPGIKNLQPGFEKQILDALDQWRLALGQQIIFEIQSLPENAQIQVSWSNSIDTQGHSGDGGTSYTAGLTVPDIRNNQLKAMHVTLATFDILGNAQKEETIYAVSLHEMGHALGILGHSENPDDVMFVRNHKIAKLSDNDVRTIRTLYSMPADVSNITSNTTSGDPLQKAQQALGRVELTIARLEKQSQLDGTALSAMNLGVAYFQKARLLETLKDPQKPAKPYYDKAITALNSAISKEPRDPKPYHKLSLVHQALNDIPAALTDIQNALARNRKEPDYYLLQSWYLVKLNRRAESQDSLNTYLQAKPEEKNNPEVKQIQQSLSNHP